MSPSAHSSDRLVWHTLLGHYPNTHALKDGTIASPLVDLRFDDVPVPNKAFKRVVRGLEYDVAELALMTFLMARAGGVPLVLMPVVLFSRNPLTYLVTRVDAGIEHARWACTDGGSACGTTRRPRRSGFVSC